MDHRSDRQPAISLVWFAPGNRFPIELVLNRPSRQLNRRTGEAQNWANLPLAVEAIWGDGSSQKTNKPKNHLIPTNKAQRHFNHPKPNPYEGLQTNGLAVAPLNYVLFL